MAQHGAVADAQRASGLGIAAFVIAWLALFYAPVAAFLVPPLGIALSFVAPVVCLYARRTAPARGRSPIWATRGLGVAVVGTVLALLVAAFSYLA
jgi:hypothetical protein